MQVRSIGFIADSIYGQVAPGVGLEEEEAWSDIDSRGVCWRERCTEGVVNSLERRLDFNG